ncbi:MAG: type IX secretion system sortase PorU [Bacteroidetes bacterium]|nr:type IX secretion system sortase PorU [Bacteroidota bacterium]
MIRRILFLFVLVWLALPHEADAQPSPAFSDTLVLNLGQDEHAWPFVLHFEPAIGIQPGLLIPIRVPAGMRFTSASLNVFQTVDSDLPEPEAEPQDFLLVYQSYDQRSETVERLFLYPYRSRIGGVEQLTSGQIIVHYDSLALHPQEAGSGFIENSVLSSGPWLKLAVVRDGVHRLTPADLVAAGWDVQQLDPQRLALFGNGGAMLPERNNAFRHDDLVENPILVKGENDGSFDPGDALYFYGQSTTTWTYNPMTIRFDHRINYYSDTSFYFLTVLDRPGLRISEKPQEQANPTTIADIFLDYALHENDLENLIHSGREWYGEYFNRQQRDRLDVQFHFPNRVAGRPVMVNTQFAVRSLTETTAFSIELNGQQVLPQQPFLPISSGAAAFAREQSFNLSLQLPERDSLDFVVRYHAAQDNSRGWINFLRVNAWRQLRYVPGRQMPFRNPEAVGFNVVPQYRIGQVVPGLMLWEVTNPLRPKAMMHELADDHLRFNVMGDSIREFILFDPADAYQPVAIRPLANQNLHATPATDMIIVAPDIFRPYAEAMAALHQAHDGLESIVAGTAEIYNEFGSGKPDPTAIRDFIRMVYLRSQDRLRYVLLFGDASYDYKNRIAGNTNFVPTYQSIQSIIETQSFVSDDYFGLMGSNEGQDMQGVLDLGIGRFPVSATGEAALMVQKNAHYLSRQEKLRGPWQNTITFMADDGDGNLHLSQAETLATHVDTAYRNFNIRKVYLDAYRRVPVPGGFRYPEASAALLRNISEGSLIVNYTGHGGVSGLTDEKVFSISEIESLTNIDRLAFFVTATCEFSRFDNPVLTSAGEQLLLNPSGGAIALMTTTRLAFAHSNFNVNRRLYASLMTNGKSDINRLGDIIRLSKNPTNSYIYNFVLLGNPALRLSYPEYRAEVLKINGKPSDTLHAMSEVVLEGRIVNPSGQLVENFNGVVEVLFFDKKSTYRTLGNDAMSMPTNFSLFDKLLFRGSATATNGLFSLRFALPRSIAYNYGMARISMFASDSVSGMSAGGWFDNIILGGIAPDIMPDNKGPEIELFVGDERFVSGSVVPESSILIAKIADPQGIHHLGSEIGRDIVATHSLPDGSIRKYVLNNYFSLDLDHPTSGSLRFPMERLIQGEHLLSLKAWDLHNNSSEKEIRFVVNPEEGLKISNVRLSPNPVSGQAVFTFEHNKPGSTLFVSIEIYNAFGSKVHQINAQMTPSGNHSYPLSWNPKQTTAGRLASGVYLWRLIVAPAEGLPVSTGGRLVIANP